MSPLDYAGDTVPERIERPKRANVLYQAVGRSATVLLYRSPFGFSLRTNGLPEAVMGRPRLPEFGSPWLGSLASLARPEARSMLVVGLGGGTLIGSVPPFVESIDIIELEPEVVEANRIVADLRAHDPLSDPRVRLIVNDARGALMLSDARYDIVVSQPSHPWTAGASHLYTADFFELVRGHLNPGGVFIQWIGLQFVDAPLLSTLVASVAAVFPHVRVYHSNPGGSVYFLGSDEPIDMVASVERAVAAAPDAMAKLGVFGAEDVEYTLALDQRGVDQLVRGVPISTDDDNLLKIRSPRVLKSPISFDETIAAFGAIDPLLRLDPRLDRYYLLERMATHSSDRTQVLLTVLGDDDATDLVRARSALRSGSMGELRATLGRLLTRNPDGEAAARARGLFARLVRSSLLAGDVEAAALEATLSPSARRVLAGWRLEAAEEWQGLEAHDPALAEINRHDSVYPYGARLRVAWREAAGDRSHLLEALDLLQTLLISDPNTADMLTWARLASRAGENHSALVALRTLAEHLDKRGDPDGVKAEALTTLLGLELDAFDRETAATLERFLRSQTSPRGAAS